MTETFTLSRPIRVGGEEVTELTLREPTVDMLHGTKQVMSSDGDKRGSLEVNADTVIKVFARMANIPPSSARMISGEDYMDMFEVYMRFFGGSRLTGGTSSES